jgi:(E)-4-hydroxy-3-methylbut-2-enyl-diphosphate synthase
MYKTQRDKTRTVTVGGVSIGGGHPISIQSMTNTDTRNVEETIRQIHALEAVGCEIARVAVPDMEAAHAVEEIRKQIHIPLVADIHFDYRLALAVLERGIDKLRINPGNIGSKERIKVVVNEAKARKIPIRIGVNGGSLDKEILEKYQGVTAEGLVESAQKHIRILEDLAFEDIVVSIKSSNVPLCLEAYELFASKMDYPLHIGITEAGTIWSGTIKSAVGIGSILSRGIGDTMRVSLTGDPIEEVKCAKEILKSMGLRSFGVELISCPTCGRTEIDLIKVANEVERRCQTIDKPIQVAVMGCAVNGPGEAKEADIGIAGGKGVGLIFKKGKIIKKVPEEQLIEALMEEIENL